jgi:uncharacterized membrane protein YfcA
MGGAIISTPLMVLLGVNPATAIATAKFGGLGITLGAGGRFFKEKLTDKRTVIIFSILGAIGALGGSLTVEHFRNHTDILQRVIGLSILLIGIPVLYLHRSGLQPKATPRWLKIAGLVLLTIGVFIQVVASAGLGSLQLIVLMSCFGMTALVANATRRAMQLTVGLVSLAVFIPNGLIDYRFGAVAAFTAMIGGYIGAHVAIKKGNKFVINFFAAASAILAIQLIFG